MRIVSLLPSATEIVCALGLGDQLVGVTHECDYPAFVSRLPRVTRTLIPHDAGSREIDVLVRERLRTEKALYSLNMPVLDSLCPDLIVTQALCDVCAVAAAEVTAAACALESRPKVVNLEPTRLAEVLDGLRLVGEAAGVLPTARRVADALQARVDMVTARTATGTARPRVVLLEWIDPPFSSGHWSPEIVEMAGGREGLGRAGERSRALTWNDVRDYDPEVLVIACCGFTVARTMQDLPILRRQSGFHEMTCVRNREVYVVDGNAYFSRPGPRLVDSLEMLAHMLHPDAHPLAIGRDPGRRLTAAELRGA